MSNFTARNRANAAHSTGPRTPQGKASSSKNATSHGLYAANVVVHAWESQAKFDQLRRDYLNRFRPIDRAERDLVDRLVDSTWRRNRAVSIETTLYDIDIPGMDEEVSESFQETDDGLLRVTLAFRKRHGDGVWEAIQRHISAAERSYQRAFRELRLLQGEDRFQQLPEPLETPAEIEEIHEITNRTQFRPSVFRTQAAAAVEIVGNTRKEDENARSEQHPEAA